MNSLSNSLFTKYAYNDPKIKSAGINWNFANTDVNNKPDKVNQFNYILVVFNGSGYSNGYTVHTVYGNFINTDTEHFDWADIYISNVPLAYDAHAMGAAATPCSISMTTPKEGVVYGVGLFGSMPTTLQYSVGRSSLSIDKEWAHCYNDQNNNINSWKDFDNQIAIDTLNDVNFSPIAGFGGLSFFVYNAAI